MRRNDNQLAEPICSKSVDIKEFLPACASGSVSVCHRQWINCLSHSPFHCHPNNTTSWAVSLFPLANFTCQLGTFPKINIVITLMFLQCQKKSKHLLEFETGLFKHGWLQGERSNPFFPFFLRWRNVFPANAACPCQSRCQSKWAALHKLNTGSVVRNKMYYCWFQTTRFLVPSPYISCGPTSALKWFVWTSAAFVLLSQRGLHSIHQS